MSTDNIAGETAAWTYIEPVGDTSYQEKPCFKKTPNCALCAGFDSNACKMCFDRYSLVTVRSQEGGKQACIDKFCPAGHRQVQNFNGVTYCQQCNISHCNKCSMINIKIGSNLTATDIEICLQCEGAFVLSPKKDECTAIGEPAGPSPRAELPFSGTKKLDFILEPRPSSLYPQNLTAGDLDSLREAE